MKSKSNLICLASLVWILLLLPAQQSKAAAVSYHTLKYQTNQTSMAAGYYAQPAQVTAAGSRYRVTMTIKTKKSLSAWPVRVISVAGQAPVSVVKTKSPGFYLYRYSFYSRLQGRVNSYISIDVPGVYKANHHVSFLFNQKQLPTLKIKKQTNPSQPKRPAMSQKKAPDSQKGSQNKPGAMQPTQANSAANKQLARNNRHKIQNETAERNFYYVILAGSLLLVIVIAVCTGLLITAAKIGNKEK